MRRWSVWVTMLLAGCSAPASGPALAPPSTSPFVPPASEASSATRAATVVDHVDGDTIDVRIGDRVERVRLIGIDTPERGQPGYAEATAFTARAVPAGARVFLTYDVQRRDRYGRALGYVWLRSPGEPARDMLNARLAARGFASTLTIPPNVAYAELFLRLSRRARAQGLGIWVPLPAGSACDPAYPSVCIRPPPPDLDCGDVAHRGFVVRPPDPHRFDQDGNGRGCES